LLNNVTMSLKDAVVQEVRNRIVDGRYTLGQRLSENIIAQEMETSRAPVRDALMILCAEGLVQVYPQRGSFVFNPNNEEKYALCEVCGVYEMGALTLALERSSNRICDVLEESMVHGEDALQRGDMSAWAKADRIFHESIVMLGENLFLTEAYRLISARISALVHRLPSNRERMQRSLAQHREIIAMICRRNFEEVAHLLRENNLHVAKLLKDV
jgi:DNA-binding GntR family transcriptional regulator